MERRAFLKTSALTMGAVSILPTNLLANSNIRKFKVIYDFDIKSDEKNFEAKLWNPMIYSSDYQKVKFLKFSGNYNDYNINEDNPYDAKVFYANWDETKKEKKLHVEMEIETTYRKVGMKFIKKASSENFPIPSNVKLYLEPTEHVPDTLKLRELSEKITKNKTDKFDKVKAIYDWVTYTTFRDPKVIGCGVGDVGKMIKSGYFGGKCTDISSLFVALLRVSGIPAREVFGIRLGKSYYSKALGKSNTKGFATISSWQHCRVEYYIPGAGWIPSDPGDITKLELVERLKYSDNRVKELKSRYLHSWEMNWVGFNHARDFTLYPKPTQFPLNMLGYPYAEANGDALNYYSPKTFAYKITSQEIK